MAGLAFGNTSACGAAPASAAAGAAAPAGCTAVATPAPPGPISMASVAVAAGTGEQTPPDLLVYSDTTPGMTRKSWKETEFWRSSTYPGPK